MTDLSSLSPPATEHEVLLKVSEVFMALFTDSAEFNSFLIFALERSLDTLTAPAKLPDRIQDLLFNQVADDTRLPRLVRAAYVKYPSNTRVRELAEELGWAEPDPTTKLTSLTKIAEAPGTRHIVAAHRAGLRRAQTGTQLVADLKGLHDLIDLLRRMVYRQVQGLSRRFPADGSSLELTYYIRELTGLRSKFAALAASSSFEPDTYPWIEENLPMALSDLRAGLEAGDPALLVRANKCLNPVVETEMTAINAQLVAAAGKLELPELISQLRQVQDEAGKGAGREDDIAGLERDIGILEEVSARLDGLVSDHNKWQRADNFADRVDSSLGQRQSFDDISLSWSLLKTRLVRLCPPGSTIVEGIDVAIDEMSRAVESVNHDKIVLKFANLSELVRDHFLRLDGSLLKECERIRQIGLGLGAVLEKVDG